MKHFKVIFKFVIFFIGWAILAGLIDFSQDNMALWRLGAELVPLLFIILFSVIFWLIDKKKIKIAETRKPIKTLVIGNAIGIVWLIVPVLFLLLTKNITFSGIKDTNYILVYSVACFFNVVLQELLIRGYLYQLIKTNYNRAFAIIISTLLFVLLHGFDLSILNIINIFATGVLLSLAMECFNSILVPIGMHFLWNYFGCMILGLGKLADDYPTVINSTIRGNIIISGGNAGIEGSLFVTIIDLLLIGVLIYKMKIKENSFITNNNLLGL